MRFKPGLSSEIIVHIILLTTAALLLSGFLVTKILERELLAQRVRSVTVLMEVLASTFAHGTRLNPADGNEVPEVTRSLLRRISPDTALEGWVVADRDAKPLSVYSDKEDFRIDESALVQARYSAEPFLRVSYDAFWQPKKASFILITVPLKQGGDFIGAFQARFSLSEVRDRIASARKLILLYAILYGIILVFFGVYALGRSVLRPVRRLREMTQRLSAGDLQQTVTVDGPVEIADLAQSFNSMAAALSKGQREREKHIEALERANAEIRKAQNELVRSEKMATVGYLSAGMAHEIGNPLGAIIGYLDLLREESSSARETEIVGRILAEAGRIDRLVRDLLDFAAPSDQQLQRFDPIGAMTEARDILSQQGVFDAVELNDQLPPSLPATIMARHKLVQVFINLLLNARDAVPSGGVIRIGAGEEKNQVWLAVTDTGCGMDAEIQAKIFEPFFSTKDLGRGRGLGLAICQRIVGEAGGHIEVASIPGEWSEFKVWMPTAGSMGDEA